MCLLYGDHINKQVLYIYNLRILNNHRRPFFRDIDSQTGGHKLAAGLFDTFSGIGIGHGICLFRIKTGEEERLRGSVGVFPAEDLDAIQQESPES